MAEFARAVKPDTHTVVLLDQAGWQGSKDLESPENITLLALPPRSPELTPAENIWQFMRDNWLSNRVFKSYEDIPAYRCYAWDSLIDQPWRNHVNRNPGSGPWALITGIRCNKFRTRTRSRLRRIIRTIPRGMTRRHALALAATPSMGLRRLRQAPSLHYRAGRRKS